MAFYYLSNFQSPWKISQVLILSKIKIIKEINNKKIKSNIKNLETYLNNTFYPVNETAFSKGYQQAQQKKITDYDNSLIEVINNFDFNTTINKNKLKVRDDQIKIAKSTLTSLKQEVEHQLDALGKLEKNCNLNNLEKIKDEFNIFANKINSIINTLNQENKSFYYFKSNENGAGSIISEINLIRGWLAVLNNPSNITNNEVGQVFEKALLKATNITVDNETDRMLNEMFKDGGHYGSKSILRGVNNTSKEESLQVSYENMGISYTYNPGAAKQGKMDVKIILNDNNRKDEYRISAKRWSKGYGDFGSTSIDAGITRASGVSVAEAYKLAVLPNFLSNATIAHDFARTALASDIIMGLNQGVQSDGGYANVLVVDTGSKIVVQDLAEITLEKIKNKKIDNYVEKEMHEMAESAYEDIKYLTSNRTNAYFLKTTSTLNKMKVTIRHSVK